MGTGELRMFRKSYRHIFEPLSRVKVQVPGTGPQGKESRSPLHTSQIQASTRYTPPAVNTPSFTTRWVLSRPGGCFRDRRVGETLV